VTWRRVAPSAAIFAAALGLYVRTLAPTVYNLDSAELATAAATGGLVRSTGYPLYLLIGRVWSLLPIGDVGYRMNLLSAVFGALTLVVVDLCLRRLEVGPWARAGALGLLAVSHYFWVLSLIAEVYTLQTLLQSLLLLALLAWQRQPGPRRLALVGLALGLGFAHHLATLFLLLGTAWLLIGARAKLDRRQVVAAALALAAGCSLYLYLTWLSTTEPAFNYAGEYLANGELEPVDLTSPRGLWWLVSGERFAAQRFGGQLWGDGGRQLLGQATSFLTGLWRAFFAVGIGPGLVGAVVLARRQPSLGGALAVMFASHSLFFMTYRVIDRDTMFLPSYVTWAVWVGVGYQALFDWLGREHEAKPARLAIGGLRAVALLAVVVAAVRTAPRVDLSNDWSARLRGEGMLALIEADALVVGGWGTAPVLEYLQLVEGRSRGVEVINRFLIDEGNLWELVEREVALRPVYLDVPVVGVATLDVEPAGALYRVVARRRVDSGADPKSDPAPDPAPGTTAGSTFRGPVR
jgi:hypothetical protein